MQSNQTKSLTKNSIYYLIYNALNVLFPLFTGIYVARTLFQSDIGSIESARNLTQYFVIFAFLGIPTYGLREISKARNDKDSLNKVYSELMVINGFSTAVFLFLYYGLIAIVPQYRQNFLFYGISGLSIALNFLNNSWMYEGLEEFKYISIRNLVFKIISFVALVFLVKSPKDCYWYLGIIVFGTAGNYFLNIINSHRFVRFSFSGIDIKRHLKPIFFLVSVNLAIEIYSLVDVTMLGFMTSPSIVAVYSYGMRINKILLQIINTFTLVLVPRIALFYKEGKHAEFNNLITKTLKVIILISLPMIIGILFTSSSLITSIYGSQYSHSAAVLNILSPILIISPIGYLLGSRMLLVTGNEKKMLFAVFAGAVANVILNSVLIGLLKEKGAALASTFSELIVMIIYIQLGKKYYKIVNLSQDLICVLLSLSLMSNFLLIVHFFGCLPFIKVIVQVVGAIMIYFMALTITKESTTTSFCAKIKRRLLFFRR